MNKVLSHLKASFVEKKTVGFYLRIAAMVIMLLAGILYAALDFGALKIEDYSKGLALGMIFAGVCADLAILLIPEKHVKELGMLIPLTLYAIGTGRMVYLAAYPMADVATGVNWFGGNLTNYLVVTIFCLLAVALAIAAAFMKQEKED